MKSYPKPTADEILSSLGRCAPWMGKVPFRFLGEGWGVWTYEVGDHVLRFPKNEWELAELETERKLLPHLAPYVTTAIPVPDVYCDNGPNGIPFAGHPMVPGTPLIRADVLLPASVRSGPARVALASSFGRDFGILLRELHSFPVEQALALDIPRTDGEALRARRLNEYERAQGSVFPLLDITVRQVVRERFAAYLDDYANFEFEPRFIHGDLDRQNILIDPTTGELTGVIDFGGVSIGKAALDFLVPVGDFPSLGIGDLLDDLLEAYGSEVDMVRAEQEVRFTQDVLWPIFDVQAGQYWENKDFVAAGLRGLQKLCEHES